MIDRLTHLKPGQECFLPFQIIDDWLEPALAEALLDYAIKNADHFRQAPVLYNGINTYNHDVRYSSTLSNVGEFEAPLTSRALAAQPALQHAFGIPAFNPSRVEIELAAHRDGAHFKRHIDTFVVINKSPTSRLLTLVLYLHRRPSSFSGGALRLYALHGSGTRDIEPLHNRLVAFPSFSPHSVEKVHCPGGGFSDQRFAINMWIHGAANPP